MKNEPMTFEEGAEVFHGLAIALAFSLSPEQRLQSVALLRIRADDDETPERSAVLLKLLADAMERPSPPAPIRH